MSFTPARQLQIELQFRKACMDAARTCSEYPGRCAEVREWVTMALDFHRRAMRLIKTIKVTA